MVSASPMLIGQAAGESPLSGLVARHLVGHGLCVFLLEQGLPLGVSLVDGVSHGRFVMVMVLVILLVLAELFPHCPVRDWLCRFLCVVV